MITTDNTIRLAEVLRSMEESHNPDGSYNPFNITFVKYSQFKKKENGKIVSLKNVVKCGLPFNVKENMQRGLYNPATDEKKTVNIWLIIEFNGFKVVW